MIMVEITDLFTRYIESFPTEVGRLREFHNFIWNTRSGDLFDRKNFSGHITASALIVDPSRSALLLIRHNALGRWLQPGGHVDPGETPIQAAFREVHEEVGIEGSRLELVSSIPFDIDTHHIPMNSAKNEDGHYHHDFRYLFLLSGSEVVVGNEVDEYRWVPLWELRRDIAFCCLAEKIGLALK